MDGDDMAREHYKTHAEFNKRAEEKQESDKRMIREKECTGCGELKGLEKFSKQKRGKCGRDSKCKECNKAYREDNKERAKAHAKAYREANKEKSKDRMKDYYEANKERIKARHEAYKAERIEKLKQIIKPNTDKKWIYLFECGIYNKIGISNDPLRRIKEVSKETGFEVKLLAIAKAYHGRTIDTEQIIQHELSSLNIPIPYKYNVISREWFFGDTEKMIEIISEYAELKMFCHVPLSF